MNRNVESHFSQLPRANIQRSIFDRSSSHKTTFNVGDLIPIYLDEVLPGDSFAVTTSKVVRLQTLLTPIYDNLYLDTYWFFVPSRLCWEHWQQFCGENTSSAWAPQTQYSMPKIASPEGGWDTGSIADYFGIPVGVETSPSGSSPNLSYDHYPTSLPFRAYALVCDAFFRDENLTDPLLIPLGDSMQSGSNGSDYITDVANGGRPFKAAKYHDYFTSCLPSPQKGEAVNVPLPVFQGGSFKVQSAIPGSTLSQESLLANPHPLMYSYHADDQKYHLSSIDDHVHATWYESDNAMKAQSSSMVSTSNHYLSLPMKVEIPASAAAGLDINMLRLAFATQRILERDARGGTRYVEILQSHFGVTSPDARLQRPEYLGGNRVPIQIHQVTNQAQGETDFLGDIGALSLTNDVHDDFEHSFTEHGYLLGLCVARYDHTYQQGLSRLWTRNDRYDFYDPAFANLGEQPVLKNELYYTGSASNVFGYQEAWAEYRYQPNRVSGEMRSNTHSSSGTAPGSLDSWHLADDYASAPTLSDSWIRESTSNVDRVLAVSSSVSNQILADFYFSCRCTRPMPMYSIPGLLDHF